MLTSIAILVVSVVFLGIWALWERGQDRKYSENFRKDWQELRDFYAKRKPHHKIGKLMNDDDD